MKESLAKASHSIFEILFSMSSPINNSNYAKMTNTNVVYVRIDKFNSGSFLIKDRNTVIGTVGPRGSFRDFPKEFSGANKKPSLSWGFKYINANNATFVIAFYKKRKFFPEAMEEEEESSEFTPETNNFPNKNFIYTKHLRG